MQSNWLGLLRNIDAMKTNTHVWELLQIKEMEREGNEMWYVIFDRVLHQKGNNPVSKNIIETTGKCG